MVAAIYPVSAQTIVGNPAVRSFVEAYDELGKSMVDRNKDAILGSPYLCDNWGTGCVKLRSSRKLQGFDLQFDLVKNEVYFIWLGKPYHFAEPVEECQLWYLDGDDTLKFFLRSNYPPIQSKTTTSLYIIEADGNKWQLLNYASKKVVDYYVYATSTERKYKSVEEWYLFDVGNNRMIPLERKMNMDSISMEPSIKAFIVKNGRPKSKPDWERLVHFLNSQ